MAENKSEEESMAGRVFGENAPKIESQLNNLGKQMAEEAKSDTNSNIPEGLKRMQRIR